MKSPFLCYFVPTLIHLKKSAFIKNIESLKYSLLQDNRRVFLLFERLKISSERIQPYMIERMLITRVLSLLNKEAVEQGLYMLTPVVL